MQVEWFSEPKRQVSIVDPWKEEAQRGSKGLVAGPSQATHDLH